MRLNLEEKDAEFIIVALAGYAHRCRLDAEITMSDSSAESLRTESAYAIKLADTIQDMLDAKVEVTSEPATVVAESPYAAWKNPNDPANW